MYLIDKSGTRAICRECRKVHAAKDCPQLEWRILLALSGSRDWGRKYENIAKALGIPKRRVQQTVGRITREDLRRRRNLG